MRLLATLGLSMCACSGVFFFTPQATVFAWGKLVVVAGGIQTHGGVVAPSPPFLVFAGGLPVARIGDITPVCPWVYPPHFSQPIVSGEPLVTTM